MYYYNVNGAALASLIPLEGLGPEVEPAGGWRLFAAVSGDPVLGRGSFKVTRISARPLTTDGSPPSTSATLAGRRS